MKCATAWRRLRRRSSSTANSEASQMGFWSGTRLLNEGAAKAIVLPFDPQKIDCSAYTLTLGEEVYITPSYGDDLRQSIKQTLATPTVETLAGQTRTKGGGQVVIPAGQFAFLLTEEIVSIPPDAMGFISLKSAAKFRGLINVSGFHVDPGFHGRLIYSVFNAGPAAIQLARGDLLFLLWITDLSGPCDDPRFRKNVPGYTEIPSSLIADVSRENHSLQALSGQINAIAEQFRIIKGVAVGIATMLALAIAIVALKPVFSDDDDAANPQPVTIVLPGSAIEAGQLPPPAGTPTPAATTSPNPHQTEP
jgi:dCTP deaminase